MSFMAMGKFYIRTYFPIFFDYRVLCFQAMLILMDGNVRKILSSNSVRPVILYMVGEFNWRYLAVFIGMSVCRRATVHSPFDGSSSDRDRAWSKSVSRSYRT